MINVIEMHGLITGKCVAGDMLVNESVAEYLVRKIANIEEQRNAALNTCSLIAEALGITGAVAGDTIAKVQQLVGENVVLNKLLDGTTATTQALNEIKAQGIDEWIASRNGRWNGTIIEAENFAASLRGE